MYLRGSPFQVVNSFHAPIIIKRNSPNEAPRYAMMPCLAMQHARPASRALINPGGKVKNYGQ